MDKDFSSKKICILISCIFLSSCGSFQQQSSNEYTVTKKSPLIMPPDMNMTPPGEGEKNNKSYDKYINKNEIFSVEDILIGESSNKKITNNKSVKKNKFIKKNLVQRILRKKAFKILE